MKAKAKMECCKHCQDFEYCDEKGDCCEYCDHFFKGTCTYEKDKKLGMFTDELKRMELYNYRGDDYGIDDYEAYGDLE